jgi:tetratricopeptide (TPR) repeat protein
MMIIGLLCFAPIVSYAQSASESYNNGVALMNKGDYQEAIASFKASMAINKSAANVKKCKAQIAKCNRLAKKKKSAGDGEKKEAAPQKQLTLSAYTLTFDAGEETKYVGIETLPESSDWMANVASEHESWCKLGKSMDGKNLQVTCLASSSTLSRQTGITVIYDQVTRFIKLTQKGNKPRIDATKADVKIKKRKGGTQKVGISCNSDTLYADNKNWELTKTPEWCEVTATSGNEITIKADAMAKNDPDFKSGRTGYIRIESQNEEFIIRVDQK